MPAAAGPATLASMRPYRTGVLLALVACLAGCAGVTQRIPVLRSAGESGATTESDLHDALGVWAASFSSLLGAAADRIHAESRDRVTRRHAVLWQLRMIPLARLAAFRPDPKAGYVASLAVASAHQAYLTTGEGGALFGAQQAYRRRGREQTRAGPDRSGPRLPQQAPARTSPEGGRRAGCAAPDLRPVRVRFIDRGLHGSRGAQQLRLGRGSPDGSVPCTLRCERHRAGGAGFQRDRARVHRSGE